MSQHITGNMETMTRSAILAFVLACSAVLAGPVTAAEEKKEEEVETKGRRKKAKK